ncbi:MAG: carbamoyltransferase HypF [Candidatus Zixiibacteriota bacterium]|nr:MAG: carbamoyltransferase HypF [candidate division Zixibacteria bacterium]
MSTPPHTAKRARRRLHINGIVQGVGFRPFVYRLARELQLSGWVRNGPEGVIVEIEGTPEALEQFRTRLYADAPPLARIRQCETAVIPCADDGSFTIQPSRHDRTAATIIPVDSAVCDDCIRELFDPDDRRYRYPFINCTNCGPRFTIVERIPYDRPFTSMKVFPLCPDCEREYNDPASRRFHAQPNACPVCGPRLIAHDGHQELTTDDPLAIAVAHLQAGRIVAVRGLGGFHLAVDATNEQAVQELRRRKRRWQKPFALMAPDLSAIESFCHVTSPEREALTRYTRPIVLLRRKKDTTIAPSVSTDNDYLGVMLPYTPLHYLLLRDNFTALVMTSGNSSDEPIAIGNDEALTRLAGIADFFLLHDRDILQRCDDSIVQVSSGATRVLRRARGYVPRSVSLPKATSACILACGGELKNTVALTRNDQIFLSQHIGDLDNPLALSFFEHAIDHLQQILEVTPDVIAHDLHPEYLSTKWALQRDLPCVAAQHHHAHLVSVQVEQGLDHPTLGIILDGTGYGTDGNIWGGEILYGDASGFERMAWLEPVPMPGGEMAIRQPWRMAVSYLYHCFGKDFIRLEFPFLERIRQKENVPTLITMIDKRLNCPLTTSCGRLFDGIAALLNVCDEIAYEAQAAIRLERLASHAASVLTEPAAPHLASSLPGPLPLDSIIRGVVERIVSATPAEEIAAWFHRTLAGLVLSAVSAARDATGCHEVALSGGVYQNRLFFEYLKQQLEANEFRVLCHREVPCNDGGIALGQAAIADAHWRRRKS